MSCVQYLNAHPESQYVETIIDVDGSGPLAPFPVRCEFFPDKRNITYVGHANEESTKVDGFEGKGSFQQVIIESWASLGFKSVTHQVRC